MNTMGRKELEKAHRLIEEAKEILEGVVEREQDSYDRLPEDPKDGEIGCKIEENISALEDAVSGLETALDSIEEIE